MHPRAICAHAIPKQLSGPVPAFGRGTLASKIVTFNVEPDGKLARPKSIAALMAIWDP